MTIKETLRKSYNKLDIFSERAPSPGTRVVLLPEIKRDEILPASRLGKSLESYALDWKLLLQLQEEFLEYKRIMSRNPHWPTSGKLKRQIEHGMLSILSQLTGATRNKDDVNLHRELVFRIRLAKNSGLRRERIFTYEDIITWAIGEKRGNWAERPGYDESEMILEDYDGDVLPTEEDSQSSY